MLLRYLQKDYMVGDVMNNYFAHPFPFHNFFKEEQVYILTSIYKQNIKGAIIP